MRNAAILMTLFLFASCEAAPLKSLTSLHPTRQVTDEVHHKNHEHPPTDEVHLKDHEDPLLNLTHLHYAAAHSHCRLHSFPANFSLVRMEHFIISPRSPIRFTYCAGSCASLYSLDSRDNTYVTYDVLIRQLANLDDVPISEEQKKKFKTICCVPVEYTNLRVVLVSKKGVKSKLWIDSIPSRCGCR